MIRESFNEGWEFRPKVSPFSELSGAAAPYQPVTLPHDALIGQDRYPPGGHAQSDGGAGVYFPGGAFEYRKTFSVPEGRRGRRILLEFEGVYRDAMVYIIVQPGRRPLRVLALPHRRADRFLRFGRDNQIRVEVRAHRDSRWYTGAGIYRDAWLLTGGLVRIGLDGVRVATPDIDAERVVVRSCDLGSENDSIEIRTPRIVTEIRDAAGRVVAADFFRGSVLPGELATARQRLYVRAPALWSPESPALYSAQRDRHGRERRGGRGDGYFRRPSLRVEPDKACGSMGSQ